MNARRYSLLSLSVIASACAPGSRVPPQTSPQTPAAQADATPVAGRWTGTYTCAQGLTGLTLTLEAGVMGQVSGRFDFHPAPGNMSVPSGSYYMMGWYSRDGTLALVGVEWIQQPGNYLMVGLMGRLTDGGRRLEGTVPECSAAFSVRRT